MICSLWWTFICENQPRWTKGALFESRWCHISSCCPQTSCVWSWGGFFPCWGAETLWLQLALLPRAGLTGQWAQPCLCPLQAAPAQCRLRRLLWSTVLTWLNARLNLLPIHFSPVHGTSYRESHLCLQHFYLCLGEANETELLWCLWTDVQQFKLPTAGKPSPAV